MLTASIVIPVFNRPDLICRCLDSALAQSYPGLEVIVVDNDSSDNTPQAVSDWITRHSSSPIKFRLVDCKRHGAPAARNRGADCASGNVMFFFDSDDAMYPDYVSRAMEIFNKHPETQIVAWPMHIFLGNGKKALTHRWKKHQTLEKHLINAVLRTHGYAVRKDLFEQAGRWNEECPVWNDWELGVRLAMSTSEIEILSTPGGIIYPQKVSITGTAYHHKAGEWEKTLDKVEAAIRNTNPSGANRYLVITAYRRVILAAHYCREGRPELASPLLAEALQLPELTKRQRLLMRYAYRYTALGGRGVFSIISPFL